MMCPDCWSTDVVYRLEHGWLAVLCAGCWLELHGVNLDVGEVAHEAA